FGSVKRARALADPLSDGDRQTTRAAADVGRERPTSLAVEHQVSDTTAEPSLVRRSERPVPETAENEPRWTATSGSSVASNMGCSGPLHATGRHVRRATIGV